MFLFKAIALVSTICLLAWMYYFLVGCGPLLVLKHDVAQDSKVIYRFFNFHYKALLFLALISAVCFLIVGNYIFSAAMFGILGYGYLARAKIVAAMEQMSQTMVPNHKPSISAFRRLHLTGFALNIVVLAGLTWAISRPELALIKCVNVPPGCQGTECRHQCSL